MEEKVVVITGASAGIGAALAERLGMQGHSLLLVARRKDLLREVAERCGERAQILAGDAGERAISQKAAAQALARFGRVDVWVNNVGQGITRNPTELTDDDIDHMMRVNVKSALYGMQAILPHFRERGEGHIINISSMLGRIPWAVFRSAYIGAKHFLNALTATVRAEVQATHPGIQVSLVSPGVVRTEFGVSARHGGPDSRGFPESQSAEEVADVIVQVIGTRLPDVYTREGARDRVVAYYETVGVDPQGLTDARLRPAAPR